MNTARRKPAAIAEPITPATFGPIACMRRKFFGLAFCPSICETLAAIGTAETPAEPMRGLIFPPESLYMSLPTRRPPIVEKQKAVSPRATILIVSSERKREAAVVAPTEMPRKTVTMFIRAF